MIAKIVLHPKPGKLRNNVISTNSLTVDYIYTVRETSTVTTFYIEKQFGI